MGVRLLISIDCSFVLCRGILETRKLNKRCPGAVGTSGYFCPPALASRPVFKVLRKYQKPFDLSRGFTLVELLVVIAIIGVLATLLLLQLNVARQKARDARRVADINQVRSALELFFDDTGTYPTSTNLGTFTYSGKQVGDYLNKIPDDPLRSCTVGVYDGATTDPSGCYGYAWDQITGPKATRFHIWAELEELAKSALQSDVDFNSVTGTGWSNKQGALVNGTLETCTDSAAVDCAYDQGQVK